MLEDDLRIYSSQDLGKGYTVLFYANDSKTVWNYRVFNATSGDSVKSNFNLLTYEACLTHAVETVIELFSRTHNYSATLNYKGDNTLIIAYVNNHTNSVELQMALKTLYNTHVDKLLVLRVLQALVEKA